MSTMVRCDYCGRQAPQPAPDRVPGGWGTLEVRVLLGKMTMHVCDNCTPPLPPCPSPRSGTARDA